MAEEKEHKVITLMSTNRLRSYQRHRKTADPPQSEPDCWKRNIQKPLLHGIYNAMNDILSQDEVDALLKGVQIGERARSSLRIRPTSPWRSGMGRTRCRRRKSLQMARGMWRRTSGLSLESTTYRSGRTNRWRALSSKYRSPRDLGRLTRSGEDTGVHL